MNHRNQNEPDNSDNIPLKINPVDVTTNGYLHKYPIPVPLPVITAINDLSFDSFARNPETDIVCISPIRTIVHRQEEIALIRKIRKVEEIDSNTICPVNTTQI